MKTYDWATLIIIIFIAGAFVWELEWISKGCNIPEKEFPAWYEKEYCKHHYCNANITRDTWCRTFNES
jgi:hypothetical protein